MKYCSILSRLYRDYPVEWPLEIIEEKQRNFLAHPRIGKSTKILIIYQNSQVMENLDIYFESMIFYSIGIRRNFF